LRCHQSTYSAHAPVTDREEIDPASDWRLKDEAVAAQLHKLGAEVVRAARQFQSDGTCDYAPDAALVQADAGSPGSPR
jgi:hypothetical protein